MSLEPEPQPEPEPQEEPMLLSSVQPIEKQTSLIEEDMNPTQKSLFRLMNKHPFEDSHQAPEVDQEMLLNLGKCVVKNAKDEKVFNVEYENGTKYEGPIVTDETSDDFEQPLNFGLFQFPNGDQYKGTVGVRASGTYTHSNGVIYEGQFFKLKKSGQGKQTFPEGHVYKGMFRENLYHGKGIFTYSNGDVFKGTFNAGRRNHIGTYTFSEGDVFMGDWQEDQLHGNGKCEMTNGQKIKSAFQGSSIKL